MTERHRLDPPPVQGLGEHPAAELPGPHRTAARTFRIQDRPRAPGAAAEPMPNHRDDPAIGRRRPESRLLLPPLGLVAAPAAILLIAGIAASAALFWDSPDEPQTGAGGARPQAGAAPSTADLRGLGRTLIEPGDGAWRQAQPDGAPRPRYSHLEGPSSGGSIPVMPMPETQALRMLRRHRRVTPRRRRRRPRRRARPSRWSIPDRAAAPIRQVWPGPTATPPGPKLRAPTKMRRLTWTRSCARSSRTCWPPRLPPVRASRPHRRRSRGRATTTIIPIPPRRRGRATCLRPTPSLPRRPVRTLARRRGSRPALKLEAPEARAARKAAVEPRAAEPIAGAPRVFVHYSTRSERGREIAAATARHLEAVGYQVADIRTVGFDVASARVRYFFDGDRPAAQRLTADLRTYLAAAAPGQPRVDLQSYTTFKPLPSPGNIEVWIPSGGGS